MKTLVLALTFSTMICFAENSNTDPSEKVQSDMQKKAADTAQKTKESISEQEKLKSIETKSSAQDDEDSYRNDKRFGAHIHLLAFPYVGGYGVDFQLNEKFTFALDLAPLKLNTGDFKMGWNSTALRVRYHPWGRAFYFGLGLGQQNINIELTQNITQASITVPTKFYAETKSMYYAPHFGWFARFEMGLFLQFDFGMRMPTSVTSTIKITPQTTNAAELAAIEATSDYAKVKKDAEDTLNTFGKQALPFFSMLTIGWLF